MQLAMDSRHSNIASLQRVPRLPERRAYSRLFLGEILLLLECWMAPAKNMHTLLVSLGGGLIMVTGTSGMPVTTPSISTGLPLAMAPDGAMVFNEPLDSTKNLNREMI